MEVQEILGKLNRSVHEIAAKVTSWPEDLVSLKKQQQQQPPPVSEANFRKLTIHQVQMLNKQLASSTTHIIPKNFCFLLS